MSTLKVLDVEPLLKLLRSAFGPSNVSRDAHEVCEEAIELLEAAPDLNALADRWDAILGKDNYCARELRERLAAPPAPAETCPDCGEFDAPVDHCDSAPVSPPAPSSVARALRDALAKYGNHLGDCQGRDGGEGPKGRACTCGWGFDEDESGARRLAALESAEAPQPAPEAPNPYEEARAERYENSVSISASCGRPECSVFVYCPHGEAPQVTRDEE